ncbi:uncharacterized protein N7469_002324 [Penicillium citrinum]|uniref:Uncharacterized protein n=1 Tax=Penicillium citrinum TaxID=5077 RepID=A0A9W9PCF9_PENCI|nr:uncharacterized protein N7469_002324 [Penicillium citrinum]KAJ5240733.1 hypothetical protein N7469_002324 [Penicillium citrinum]
MPPIRSQKTQKSVEQKDRILLVVKAIKNKEISSICKAVHCFDVLCATLQNQLCGYQFRYKILSMDLYRNPLRSNIAKNIVNLLFANYGTISFPTIGVN